MGSKGKVVSIDKAVKQARVAQAIAQAAPGSAPESTPVSVPVSVPEDAPESLPEGAEPVAAIPFPVPDADEAAKAHYAKTHPPKEDYYSEAQDNSVRIHLMVLPDGMCCEPLVNFPSPTLLASLLARFTLMAADYVDQQVAPAIADTEKQRNALVGELVEKRDEIKALKDQIAEAAAEAPERA